MEKNFITKMENATPVVCVLFSGSEIPAISEYNGKNILSTIPAWKKDEKFFSVQTGKELTLNNKQMVIWPLMSGCGFFYSSGEKIFLTRDFFGEKNFFWLIGDDAAKFELGNTLKKYGCITKFNQVKMVHKKYHQVLGM